MTKSFNLLEDLQSQIDNHCENMCLSVDKRPNEQKKYISAP